MGSAGAFSGSTEQRGKGRESLRGQARSEGRVSRQLSQQQQARRARQADIQRSCGADNQRLYCSYIRGDAGNFLLGNR